MMTYCLSSLISLDLVSHVSYYTVSHRDSGYNLMSLLPPTAILGGCLHNASPLGEVNTLILRFLSGVSVRAAFIVLVFA